MLNLSFLRYIFEALGKLTSVRRITFKNPENAQVLIWDEKTSADLQDVFKLDTTFVLSIRGEVVHFWSALWATWSTLKGDESFTVNYTLAIIRRVQPKIVITCSDINLDFYRLSRNFAQNLPIFVVVQNSIRRGFEENYGIGDTENDMAIDIAFVYSKAIGHWLYRPFVGKDCKIIAFGSLRSSIFSHTFSGAFNAPEGKYVCYVSDYRNPQNLARRPNPKDRRGREVTYEMLYAVEPLILAELKKFCRSHDIGVVVAASRIKEPEEKKYFEKHLGLTLQQFVTRTRWSSYEAISGADVVLTIDSTLGYEALSMGKKTLVCSARVDEFDFPSFRCGWPLNFSKFGSFWMNEWNPKVFSDMMSSLLTSDTQKFRRNTRTQVAKIINSAPDPMRVRSLSFELADSRSASSKR